MVETTPAQLNSLPTNEWILHFMEGLMLPERLMAYQNHHIDLKGEPKQGQRVNRCTAIAVSMIDTLLFGTLVPAIHESNGITQFSQSANVRMCQPLKHSVLKCVACH
jgi:hypothetical protein